LFLAKQFDKAGGEINLKHGKYVLKNRIGEVIVICTLDHELYKLGKIYIFSFICFRHHGQVFIMDVYDVTPKTPKNSPKLFPIFSLCMKKKSMLKRSD